MKMPKASDPAPMGSFEEQVMLAVLRTQPDSYGMNVRRELGSVTGREVTIGSVYITLDRLEAKGLLASARVAAQGEAGSRRTFSVTEAGARALAVTRSLRERLWAGIELQPLLRKA
jgi:PadR family transcriptional regulator PadR